MIKESLPSYLEHKTASELREMAKSNRKIAASISEPPYTTRRVEGEWQSLHRWANELSVLAAEKEE